MAGQFFHQHNAPGLRLNGLPHTQNQHAPRLKDSDYCQHLRKAQWEQMQQSSSRVRSDKRDKSLENKSLVIID